MTKDRTPVTPCILTLRQQGIKFNLHAYRYEERGGTRIAAKSLGVEEHIKVKTLVMEDDQRIPFIVLMHGDREVSTKNLARVLGVKSVSPCDQKSAEKHTGYRVGGTSPFGTKKPLPVYMEETIAGMPKIFINAGSRGLLAQMDTEDLVRLLHPRFVKVAI